MKNNISMKDEIINFENNSNKEGKIKYKIQNKIK